MFGLISKRYNRNIIINLRVNNIVTYLVVIKLIMLGFAGSIFSFRTLFYTIGERVKNFYHSIY